MRIAIFGAGGVGGYFGGRLAQAGEDVVFIARGDHLQAMSKSGLRVDSINGDFVLESVQATDDPAGVGIVDMVLLGVKAWQVPEAAEAIQPMVGSETVVLPLQNGVDAPSQLAAVLGDEHVLCGLCGLMTFIVEPGHICHAGADPFIRFGESDNRHSERVERLNHAFDQASGINAEIPPDIQVALWEKFLFVTPWSGVGAVTRSPIWILRSQPGTRGMLKHCMREIYDVGRAHNIALPEDIIGKTMDFVDSLPKEGTASMQRDIMNGRPSELEAQNGAVVRLGGQVGVETPINTFIYNSLLPMEMRARDELQFPE
jgi:2-dehydropantoate 2-reductase